MDINDAIGIRAVEVGGAGPFTGGHWTLGISSTTRQAEGRCRVQPLGEIVMDSFVVRPATWPIVRIFSRNPLMRSSDRIEAAIVPVAAFLVIAAIAGAGVLGTLAHDVESRRYQDDAKERHSLMATAVEDSTPENSTEPAASKVVIRWQADGFSHTDSLTLDQSVKATAPLQIWVDKTGNRVEAPTPPALAGANAVLTAAVAWWVIFLASALTVGAVRSRIEKMRDAQWDRSIRLLLDGEDGRTNRSQ